MTDKESFDVWCGYNGQTPTASKLHVWQAALATAPAWHDAPTVPGLWINDDFDSNLSRFNFAECQQVQPEPGLRWFGPISEDTGGKPCPYCTSDNAGIREAYFDQTCEGCCKRMSK